MDSDCHLLPLDLKEEEEELYRGFLEFVREDVEPVASAIDSEDKIPESIFEKMAVRGLWGAAISKDYGGLGLNAVEIGLLCRALGRVNASILSLCVVHCIVGAVLTRWGTPSQKETWLSKLAKGELRGSVALTEPQGGSDAAKTETCFYPKSEGYVIHGHKKWVSGGQTNRLFMISGKLNDKPSVLMAEIHEEEGCQRTPINDMAGFRGAALADLQFANCFLSRAQIIGTAGFGDLIAIGFALDLGRFCIGWGAAGLAEACFEKSLDWVRERKRLEIPIDQHQLVQRLLTKMLVEVTSARLVCHHAALVRKKARQSINESFLSKYIASLAARRTTECALQIAGAHGFTADSPMQRYWRDARIMEIIEGTTQISETYLGRAILGGF